MRNLLAWGMDVAVCDDEVKRAKAIVLMDEDTSFYYIAFTDEFFAKSFKKNFGFGDQLFLGLKYWKIAHEVSDIAEIVAEHYRDKTQPQLFDEAV